MAEKDFLWFIFKLNPFLTAFIVLFLGFGSLVLVALKTKSFEESILKSPCIIIGDFFLLPVAGFFITFFYQSIQEPLALVSSPLWNLTLIIAAVLTLFSISRFRHLNFWWLPHNFFYFLMSYVVITFLSKGLLQLTIGKEGALFWVFWVFVLFFITIHQLLGIFFPKRFPQI